jgi:type II secretory pathway component PulF
MDQANDSQEDPEKPDSAPRGRAPLAALAAGAFIFVALFFYINYFVGPKFIELFNSLRVDLPMPTRATLFLIGIAPTLSLCLLGLAFLLFHFRARIALIVLIIFLSGTMGLEALSIYLPIVKIQEALRKK